jgi:ubiquinone/menaquinone biosynthesis C-methylase UbiE
MAESEARHFWFRGTRAVIRSLLARTVRSRPGRVLDLGCGTGFTLGQIDADLRVGLDASPDALAYARERRESSFVAGSAEALPFRDGSFDAAIALDVLEHLADDGGAAREAHRVLRPGGVLLVTVPAFRALWSAHDEALHHLRRYRKAEVQGLLSRAGFEVTHAGYYDFFLFPAIALVRLAGRLLPTRGPRASDVSLPPRPINAILASVLGAERHLVGRVPLPFGVSVIATARRG